MCLFSHFIQVPVMTLKSLCVFFYVQLLFQLFLQSLLLVSNTFSKSFLPLSENFGFLARWKGVINWYLWPLIIKVLFLGLSLMIDSSQNIFLLLFQFGRYCFPYSLELLFDLSASQQIFLRLPAKSSCLI